MAVACFICSNEPSSSILFNLGSDSCSFINNFAPVKRQICFEFTPPFPIIPPVREASILIFAVDEAPKFAAAASPGGAGSRCGGRPPDLPSNSNPGLGRLPKGPTMCPLSSSCVGMFPFLSSFSPWAK
eukprot:Gb_25368 [translate_table: standard]